MIEILAIDDDPIHHEMLEAFFKVYGGTRVVKVLSGTEGLKLLTRSPERFALVLCDLNMPDFDGVELLRHLSDIECRVPLLIVSGAQCSVVKAATELAKVYGLNLIGTLIKPLSFPALSGIVRPWLDAQAAAAPIAAAR